MICASQDQLTPVKYGRYLHERIAGAHLAEIPDAGHMMALENSAAVIDAIDAFLEKM